MNNIDFDTPVDRSGTASIKWDRYKGQDIIPLWVADMDFRSPAPVLDALIQRVQHGVFGYGAPSEELVETVLSYLWREYGWEVLPDWLIWLPGLVTGLNLACRSVGGVGGTVATFTPVYPPFMSAPINSSKTLKRIPLKETDDGWMPDMDGLMESTASDGSLFLLCNPHNPVGQVFNRHELEKIAEICLKNRVTICSDEIHAGLILDPDKRHVPMATLSREVAEQTITLMAPSKTFNIPGLGCSFAVISNPGLRKSFKQVMAGIVPHVNVLGFTAALAAYRDCAGWHMELLEYLRKNRDLVHTRINSMPGLSSKLPEATYLTWIDARQLDVKNPSVFFESAGVGLSDGAEFGADGFLRLNFGCSRVMLEKALDRMSLALRGL